MSVTVTITRQNGNEVWWHEHYVTIRYYKENLDKHAPPLNPKLERWQAEKRPAKLGQHGKSRGFNVKDNPGDRKTRNKGSFTRVKSTKWSSKVLWKSFDMSRVITRISVETGVWWMRTMHDLPTQIRITSNAHSNTTTVNYKACQAWAGRGHRGLFLSHIHWVWLFHLPSKDDIIFTFSFLTGL